MPVLLRLAIGLQPSRYRIPPASVVFRFLPSGGGVGAESSAGFTEPQWGRTGAGGPYTRGASSTTRFIFRAPALEAIRRCRRRYSPRSPAAFATQAGPGGVTASSHREAPLIAGDPRADNTDVYAFVSPDEPDTVTLIANWIPFEEPNGGPNFYPWADDTRYNIKIDNDGDALADLTYTWMFDTVIRDAPSSSCTTPDRSRRSTTPTSTCTRPTT